MPGCPAVPKNSATIDHSNAAVVPTEISIEDEIVVPASYEDHMQRIPEATGHNGLLARVFGKENVEHLSQSLKRAWGRHDEPVKKDEPKKAVPKKETPEK